MCLTRSYISLLGMRSWSCCDDNTTDNGTSQKTLAAVRGEGLLRQPYRLQQIEGRSSGKSVPNFTVINLNSRDTLPVSHSKFPTHPPQNSHKCLAQSLLDDLALSDYNLQDALIGADNIQVSEREVDGQTFIDFDLYGFFGAIFASVTVYGGRLYAVFSNVPDR